jgi:hypothetical protein
MAAKWKIINMERKSVKRQMEPNIGFQRGVGAKNLNSDSGNGLELGKHF